MGSTSDVRYLITGRMPENPGGLISISWYDDHPGVGIFFVAWVRYTHSSLRILSMIFEILTFVIGIAFGFIHKGKEDYWGILRNGALIGIVVGLASVLLSMYLIPGGLSLNFDFLGAFGIILVVILFIVIMVAGAFIGDRIERMVRK